MELRTAMVKLTLEPTKVSAEDLTLPSADLLTLYSRYWVETFYFIPVRLSACGSRQKAALLTF